MTVEIIGLVGSGKSSVASAVLARNGSVLHGLSLRRLRYLPQAVWSFLRLLRTGCWYQPTRITRPWYVLKLLWHLDTQLDILVRQRQSGECILFDEGPIFKLCWISVSNEVVVKEWAGFESWYQQTLERCGSAIDYVIWLDAADAVLLSRINNRELQTGYGLKNMPEDEALRMLNTYRRTYENIMSALEREGLVRVVRFDTSSMAPTEIAESILSLVDKVKLANCRIAGAEATSTDVD